MATVCSARLSGRRCRVCFAPRPARSWRRGGCTRRCAAVVVRITRGSLLGRRDGGDTQGDGSRIGPLSPGRLHYDTQRPCVARLHAHDQLAAAAGVGGCLMGLIRSALHGAHRSTIRGMLLEEHAHHRLASGGSVRVRRPDGPANGSGDGAERVTFEALDTLIVQGADDIRAGRYCRPRAQNFESIDAVVPPSSLFQATTGGGHPVKHHGLAQLQPKLAGSGPIRLYFGVPPDRWASFGRQSYVTKEGVLAWIRAAWCGCSERLRTLWRHAGEGRRWVDRRTRAAVCAGAGAQARR
jgi:hypothetical protein